MRYLLGIKGWLIVAGLAIAAFLTNNRFQRKVGADENQAKQEEVDHENAANIRKRVDDVKPMHNDKFKFRD